MVSIIAAIGENGELGKNNRLLWRLPADMKRFKDLTTGHTIIMGRKTFESLPNGALPDRTNVIISKSINCHLKNCEIYDNIYNAIFQHSSESEIFIIGGSEIYNLSLKIAEKMYITRVHHSFPESDVMFPEISEDEWVMYDCVEYPADEKHIYSYSFQTFLRKNNHS